MREARAALKQQWTEHMGAEEHAQSEALAIPALNPCSGARRSTYYGICL
jgi:hypothetical protein